MTRIIDALNEADRPSARLPGIDYEEKGKTKRDTAEGLIDQVIAYLTGDVSGKYTRLANRFRRVKRIKELLAKEQASLNVDMKEAADQLFPAADDVYTRVIDTISLIIKVGKAEERTMPPTFDKDGYIAELEALVPELGEKLEELRKQYTTIHDAVQIEPKLLTPKLKDPKQESIDEGVVDATTAKIMNYVNRVREYFAKWGQQYDAKLAKINAKYL